MSRTIEMEIDANAKGSPMMFPTLNVCLLESIMLVLYGFFKEGECREPYEGMKDSKWSRRSRCKTTAQLCLFSVDCKFDHQGFPSVSRAQGESGDFRFVVAEGNG